MELCLKFPLDLLLCNPFELFPSSFDSLLLADPSLGVAHFESVVLLIALEMKVVEGCLDLGFDCLNQDGCSFRRTCFFFYFIFFFFDIFFMFFF